jgi:hypothetical protein
MNARGRPCTAAFSPRGYFVQVPAGRVQDELRACFARWGLPESVQVDNGKPWGSCGDLPTPPAAWLIGLGVRVAWIPPRTPQDNGVVERGQGVAKDWAEPERCRSPEELQARLEAEDRVQRECYPHAGAASRMAAYRPAPDEVLRGHSRSSIPRPPAPIDGLSARHRPDRPEVVAFPLTRGCGGCLIRGWGVRPCPGPARLRRLRGGPLPMFEVYILTLYSSILCVATFREP